MGCSASARRTLTDSVNGIDPGVKPLMHIARSIAKYRGIPPYPETRNSVRKITGIYKKTSHPDDGRHCRALADHGSDEAHGKVIRPLGVES